MTLEQPNVHPQADQKRRRTSKPRSRSGCNTCKIRRVKCDETKPHCEKCTATGRTCDGYKTPLQTTTTTTTTPAITSYALPFSVPGSQKDRQALHYFVVEAADALSGSITSHFWRQFLLQHSHENKVVRQAVIALSCLHRDYATGGIYRREDSSSYNLEAVPEDTMLQYNRAVRSLRRHIDNAYINQASGGQRASEGISTALICCALFYCFESARNNASAAFNHLRHGVTIIRQFQLGPGDSGVGSDDESMHEMINVFTRLDLQATMYDNDRLLLMSLDRVPYADASTQSFSSLSEAHTLLTELQARIFQLLITHVKYKFDSADLIPPSIVVQKEALILGLEKWMEVADTISNLTDWREFDQQGWRILRLQAQTSYLLLASNYPNDPKVFGAGPSAPQRTRVRHCLRLAGAIVAELRGRKLLSAEVGVVSPLFLLAMKSNDGEVVRRALGLLADIQRREGLFDAARLAQIAERSFALPLPKQGDADFLSSQLLHDAEEGDGTVLPAEYRIVNDWEGGLDELEKSLGTTSLQH